MKTCQTRLAEPTEALREAYLEFVAEFAAAGETDIHGCGAQLQAGQHFGAFVQRLRDAGRGVGLKEGYVPASTWWLVRGGRVIGTANLRYALNDHLRSFGGHIGYAVRPGERGKGYGSLQLRLVLDEARRIGLVRVLVACYRDNLASARVIRRCGGVLEGEAVEPKSGKVLQRYWIELNQKESEGP